MSIWYKNYYGDAYYNKMVENRKGYYRYEVYFTNDYCYEKFNRIKVNNNTPTLYNIISLEELSSVINDHWIQENGSGKGLSGKIHVDRELDYKKTLLDLEKALKTNLYKNYRFTEIDYIISELGYINVEDSPKDFFDNYWLTSEDNWKFEHLCNS